MHKLLHPPRIRLRAVLSKSIPGPPLGVLAEVVRCELARLPQQRAVEGAHFVGGGVGHALAMVSRSITVREGG